MSIKKYFANADTTITDAFRSNLSQRGTDANMGLSDILEIFSIYGQASSGSTELERCLIEFPITQIITDRAAELIPASGSVNFYLKMYNAPSNETLPRHMTLNVYAVSRSWQEGIGLDMEEYTDIVYPGNIGATWMSASSTEAWTRMGGDYHASPLYSSYFDLGYENLKVDVTPLVEEWITGSVGGGKDNYGFGIHLTGTQEAYYSASADSTGPLGSGELVNLTGSQTSYYTKKFFGRGSEFYYRRPVIEACWDSSTKDDRGRMHISSSLLSTADNTYNLYLYNIFGGRLKNIPAIGTGSIFVEIFSASAGGASLSQITGSHVSTGIYSAAVEEISPSLLSLETLYDRWGTAGLSTAFHTGSFKLLSYEASSFHPSSVKYVSNITNLQAGYTPEDIVRLRLFTRLKNWSPTIYTVANSLIETSIIPSASYEIYRVVDDLTVINYGTASNDCTLMSYDVSGNYFDLDMSLLEPGYSYGIKIAFYDEKSWVEQPYTWKFRVDELNEY